MKAPEWVEREAVLALHEQLLASFGGSAGVRDQGLLESALARPRDRFAYGALIVKQRASDPADFAALFDWVAGGLHPESRPAGLRRAFPFTIPR